MIRYAKLEDAKLYFCSLNTDRWKLKSNPDLIPDGEVISLSQYPTTKSLKDVLAEHLSRANMPKDEDQYKAAASKIAVIEYPITLLKGGLEIYDIPGDCSDDMAWQKELRQSFLRTFDPYGVVFCFESDVFTDTVMNTYNDMAYSRLADVNIELRNTSRTFFANTKFELFSFAYDIDRDLPLEEVTNDMISEEEKICIETILSRTKSDGFKEYTYSLVNTVENSEGCGEWIFDRFIKRLATWIVSLQQCRFAMDYRRIADGCNTFFQNYNVMRPKTIANIAKQSWLGNGKEAMENLRPILLTMIDTILKSIVQHFEDFLTEHDLYNKSVDKAKSIVHPEHDDSTISSAVEKSMMLVFDRTDVLQNDFLLDVIQQSFLAIFLKNVSTDKIVIGSVGGIIPSMISLLVVPKKIDDDFKVKLTNKVFNKIRQQVKAMDMRTKLAEIINKTIDSLIDNIPLRLRDLKKLYEEQDDMDELKPKFGKIGAEALSTLSNLMDPSYRPLISSADEDIGGNMYKGTLKGVPVAIKTISYSIMIGEDDEMAESMFFEELNNSYQLTKIYRTSKYLIPLLGVFNDEIKMEWQIVYPLYDCNLFNYLQRRITNGNILKWSETLSIAIDVATCIGLLHKNKIIHRDIKLENIFINFNKNTEVITHLILVNYGATNTNVEHSLDIKRNEDHHYTMETESVDIYSLSCILYELVPRNTLQRSHNNDFTNIHGAPDEYRQLIMDCAQIYPNLRPNINEVRKTLSSIVHGLTRHK
ncbi:hypothetical protein SAMD00019534_049000 [Acytostelium subglobosum LB1]|uniref:hypothetical protein n=1 Tax=Acytostelium subglobosum LB1 TaxID=1410327 RepID=UPI000644BA0D|nr:hypothetical protein SAMD00019534_049000 [Acytostelium subglobosum LB1]GAM21725.1 hypothetical protein SAMD00019534_049000 [Acytostelium subglobosum LB1]|eukprot:XP_012754825.1 hypothetical protein SAMD00019534_049000 [Acytostelium subglobosum LB1]